MNFFSHKIANPTGGGLEWSEWLAREIERAKTASEAKPECNDDPRGQCRGQIINNDNESGAGYQKGESVTGKKEQGGNARKDTGGTTDQKSNKQTDKKSNSNTKVVEAKCGKEMGESKDVGKITEKHVDAGPGNDEQKEPKVMINNDPNYQKGESINPAKARGKSKTQPGDKVVGKGKKSSYLKFTKIASLENKAKMSLFAMLSASRQNILNHPNPLAYVEAMAGVKFANMKEDEKRWFKDFWEVLYPPDYVEEMVKDR